MYDETSVEAWLPKLILLRHVAVTTVGSVHLSLTVCAGDKQLPALACIRPPAGGTSDGEHEVRAKAYKPACLMRNNEMDHTWPKSKLTHCQQHPVTTVNHLHVSVSC